MDIRQRLGLNVRRARQALGWSQEDLALESGFHRTYVSGIERGVRNPTVSVIAEIAATLGVTPGQLLDEKPR